LFNNIGEGGIIQPRAGTQEAAPAPQQVAAYANPPAFNQRTTNNFQELLNQQALEISDEYDAGNHGAQFDCDNTEGEDVVVEASPTHATDQRNERAPVEAGDGVAASSINTEGEDVAEASPTHATGQSNEDKYILCEIFPPEQNDGEMNNGEMCYNHDKCRSRAVCAWRKNHGDPQSYPTCTTCMG